MTATNPNPVRPLYEIAAEIKKTWKNVYFAAVPYLDAMSKMNTVAEGFIADSGEEVVLRFLSNATYWRGEDAKRIKAELKSMLPKH